MKYHCTEGKVAVYKKIPIEIGKKRASKKRITRTETSYIKPGHTHRVHSYRDIKPEQYNSLEAVEKKIDEEINKWKGQKDNIAQLHYGELLMLKGDVAMERSHTESESYEETFKAIIDYEAAVAVYEKIHSEDHLNVAEADIALAGAYYHAAQDPSSADGGAAFKKKGDESLSTAIALIEEDFKINKDHYDHFVQDNDLHTAWAVGKDLVHDYEDLGWAYELKGDTAKSNEYYRLADELREKIKNH